jgi:hypothetical protein
LAIKGKKRSKGRSGRGVATAPRPFLVPPKTPLMRRKGTQLVLILLLLGAVTAVAFGIRSGRETERLREQVASFESQLQGTLAATQVGQQLPSGPPLILPELGQALSEFQAGEGNPRRIRREAEGWAERAAEAAERVSRIETNVAELSRARNLMANGFRLYSSLSRTIAVAMSLEGSERRDLLEVVVQQFDSAARVFDSGWNSFTEARARAGIEEAGLPQQIPADPLQGG